MADGGRSAAARWAAVDLRRRWRSLLVLGVLAGVTAGLAMAALAGARRTDTATARLRSHTNASDAVVFSGQVGAFHPTGSGWRRNPRSPPSRSGTCCSATWTVSRGRCSSAPTTGRSWGTSTAPWS